MVRIYCLSRITKIHSSENPVNISPYDAEELIDIENFTEMIDFNNPVQTSHFSVQEKLEKNDSNFRLTEISIGFSYSTLRSIHTDSNKRTETKTKGYAINIYRKDIEILSFVLKRGTVIFKPVSTYSIDFIVKTSVMYDEGLDFDLFINVRCIRNTIIKGIINPSEEAYYEEYADKLAQNQIDDNEPNFIDFKLPNETKLNVLRTKISDFKALVNLLCNPENGSFKNVSMANRYNQELKCLLHIRKLWKTKNFRKDEFEMQINNFNGCGTLRWEKVNFGKLTADIKNVGSMTEIDFDACRITNHKNEIYPNFKILNFSSLITLNLQSCGLKTFSDEFIDLLFPCLEKINLEHNDLTFTSPKISKFICLKHLWIGNNRNLSDNGIPWKCLPENIEFLSLDKTNITKIPSEIGRLKILCIFSASGKNLNYISWKDFGSSVKYLFIYNAKNLNKIELINAQNLSDLVIKNANLTDINFEKLPEFIAELNLEKNTLERFDTKMALRYLVKLNLSHNKLKCICWENLPSTLRELTLNNNELETIGDIGHLTALYILSVNSNKLSSLSVNAENLNTLCLNSNQIEVISDTISNLHNLGTLELSKNKLSKLPDTFHLLTNLHTLYLSNNDFKYFDHSHSESLIDRLWKKLPTTKISNLYLDGNELYELPCILQNYPFTHLRTNNCKLVHICPCAFKKCREDENVYQDLSVKNNSKLKYLSFVPKKIFQPPTSKNKFEESSNDANFKIITDNENFVNSSKFKMHFKKPVYEFRNFEENDNYFGCSCCGICGNSNIQNRLIEQMMVSDYTLAVENSVEFENYDEYIDSDGELKTQGTVGNCSLIFGLIYAPKIKEKLYCSGEWKTNVLTRICEKCLKNIKEKIDIAYEESVKNLANTDGTKMKKIKQVQLSESEDYDLNKPENYFYSFNGNNEIVYRPPALYQDISIENNEQNLQYLSFNPIQQQPQQFDNTHFAANDVFNMPPVNDNNVQYDDYHQQIQNPYYQPQYDEYSYQEVQQGPPQLTYSKNETFQQPSSNTFSTDSFVPNNCFNSVQTEPELTSLQPLPGCHTLLSNGYCQPQDYGNDNNGEIYNFSHNN